MPLGPLTGEEVAQVLSHHLLPPGGPFTGSHLPSGEVAMAHDPRHYGMRALSAAPSPAVPAADPATAVSPSTSVATTLSGPTLSNLSHSSPDGECSTLHPGLSPCSVLRVGAIPSLEKTTVGPLGSIPSNTMGITARLGVPGEPVQHLSLKMKKSRHESGSPHSEPTGRSPGSSFTIQDHPLLASETSNPEHELGNRQQFKWAFGPVSCPCRYPHVCQNS